MVRFGETLLEAERENLEKSAFYINYHLIKLIEGG